MLGSWPLASTTSTFSDPPAAGQRSFGSILSTHVCNQPPHCSRIRLSNGKSQICSSGNLEEIQLPPETVKDNWDELGPWKETLNRLGRPGVQTDFDTFAFLLQCCGNAKALVEGKLVHKQIIKDGHKKDRFLGNFLIQMYGKCGALDDAHAVFASLPQKNVFTWTMMMRACLDCGNPEDARRIFYEMPDRNVVSWNVIIAAYAQRGQRKEVLELFQQMKLEVAPDKITFLSLLSVYDSKAALSEGKQTHALILKNGLESNTALGNALLNMYGKCGSPEHARRVFDRMPERDLFSWNTMISVYAQNRQGNEALKHFSQMQLEGPMPNGVTYVSLLDACAIQVDITAGKQMHNHVVGGGFESNVVVGTALVNMYGKCSSLEDAKRTFAKMSERDLVSWNAMIETYAQHGLYVKAVQLYQQMQLEDFTPDKVTFLSLLSSCADEAALKEGRQIHRHIQSMRFDSDIVMGNALVNMYGKCGSTGEAQNMFNQMPEQDVISWNALITAHAQHGQGKKVLQMFQDMQQGGIVPNKVTVMGVLDACASQGILADGKRVHAYIEGCRYESAAEIGSTLVKMYSKCGSLEDAQRVFDERYEKDVVLWNAMIAAYAQHGHGITALQLFEQMRMGGVQPNNITFVSVFSACSHSGLVDEGCHYFVSMIQDHGITPTLEHYNIMVDLLGRAGLIADGEDFVKNMPLQPTSASWMTLLAACRKHFDVERGQRIAEHAFGLDPESAAPFVLFSNICGATGRVHDASENHSGGKLS